ncbi:hypothetical protein Baya_16060 [Bagarius yarrelli]|uniref:Uncharacterized protein n=1 Tax=Bagarius yarrelli TaxID=175774 RepID=A0A556VU92_BAGYA|nr:hypothetical protein Baya_16060 [Bagarius yarrelli]
MLAKADLDSESLISVSPVQSNEIESPESEEVVKAAPVQPVAKSQTIKQRKHSKAVVASKKRTRPVRP